MFAIDEPDGFDWDDGNRQKCQKHGVSVSEIDEFFSGSPRVVPSESHSEVEERYIAVGSLARRPATGPAD
jgi:uncharacterized DUF497 family protein